MITLHLLDPAVTRELHAVRVERVRRLRARRRPAAAVPPPADLLPNPDPVDALVVVGTDEADRDRVPVCC
jgi:hypothetical protein